MRKSFLVFLLAVVFAFSVFAHPMMHPHHPEARRMERPLTPCHDGKAIHHHAPVRPVVMKEDVPMSMKAQPPVAPEQGLIPPSAESGIPPFDDNSLEIREPDDDSLLTKLTP